MRRYNRLLALLLALLILPLPLLSTEVAAVPAIEPRDAFGIIDNEHDDESLLIEPGTNDTIHAIWIRNGTKLMYALWSAHGTILINATILADANITGSIISHAAAADDDGSLQISWLESDGAAGGNSNSLRYIFINVTSHPLNGSTLNGSEVIIGPQSIIIRNGGVMTDIDMAIDSKGAAHIVWVDDADPLSRFYGTTQVRYEMIEPKLSLFYADAKIHDTLLTTTYGQRGNPAIAIDDDDQVVVVWDDVRGSLVEILLVMPVAFSADRVWRDVCTILYGGSYDSSYSESLKDLTADNGITLLETVYGLNEQIPAQIGNSDNCQGKKTNARSKTTYLTPTDHSGELRKLHETVYNNAGPNPWWRNEALDWGPGTTWACFSWRDVNGGEGASANPPSQTDHRWNPDAEHIVMPLGEAGPYAGGSTMDGDDVTAINEAHDSCADADVEVVPMRYNSPAAAVYDTMIDLAWCPESAVNTTEGARDCDGTTSRETNLRGDIIWWRDTSSTLDANWRAFSDLANSGQRSLWMTALDPYGKIEEDTTWVSGSSAHFESQGRYQEDIGRGRDGHLVVVNDTSLNFASRIGSDSHPSIAIDSTGDLHIAWMSTGYDSERDRNPTEIEHQRFDLPDLTRMDGRATGMELSDWGGQTSTAVNVSEVESDSAYGFGDSHPDITIDDDEDIHIIYTEQYYSSNDHLIHASLSQGDLPSDAYDVERSILSTYITDRFEATNLPQSDPRTSHSGRGTNSIVTPEGIYAAYDGYKECTPSLPQQGSPSSICIAWMTPSLHRFRLIGNSTLPLSLEPGGKEIIRIEAYSIDSSTIPLSFDFTSAISSGNCNDWEIEANYVSNSTLIQDGHRITSNSASESVQIYLTLTAPSAQQVTESTDCTFNVRGTDTRFNAGDAISEIEIPARVVVTYDLRVSAVQYTIEIEQGLEGTFSIEIENAGNTWVTAAVPNASTAQGGVIWNIPFGWSIDFLESVTLSPGQSTTAILRIIVPTEQAPQNSSLYLQVSAIQDPSPSLAEGSLTGIDLAVTVRHRKEGNIVLYTYDTSESVKVGECAEFKVDVLKRYNPGNLIFSIPTGPENIPVGVLEAIWKQHNWTYEVDFSEAPGAPGASLATPRYWGLNDQYPLSITYCSPTKAMAGELDILTLRAALADDVTVYDEVTFHLDVLASHSANMLVSSPQSRIESAAGERVEVVLEIENSGNVAEPISLELGTDDGWLLQVAEDAPAIIPPDEIVLVTVFLTPPDNAPAGSLDLNMLFTPGGETLANCTVPFSIETRVDLTLEMESLNLQILRSDDPSRYDLIIRNRGNVPDEPTLTLHARTDDGSISENPTLGELTGLSFTWVLEEGPNLTQPRTLIIDDSRQAELGLLPAGGVMKVSLTIEVRSAETRPILGQHQIGAKVNSLHGAMNEGGDIDDSRSWLGSDYDSNERILIIEFIAPDLRVGSVELTETSTGDTSVRLTIENHGNAAVTNVVIQFCAEGDAAKVLEQGCSGFDLRVVMPVIDAASTGQIAERQVEIDLSPRDGLEWTVLIDPEGVLGDISREGDTASITLQALETENTGLDSIFGGEAGVMRNAMIALWAIIGLLVGGVVIKRLGNRRSKKKDPWHNQQGLWAGEAASRDEAKERRNIASDLPSMQGGLAGAALTSMDSESSAAHSRTSSYNPSGIPNPPSQSNQGLASQIGHTDEIPSYHSDGGKSRSAIPSLESSQSTRTPNGQPAPAQQFDGQGTSGLGVNSGGASGGDPISSDISGELEILNSSKPKPKDDDISLDDLLDGLI